MGRGVRHLLQGIPLHPVLLSLAMVLQFTLTAGVDIRSATRPLILATAGAVLLVSLVWIVTGRRHLAGIVVDVVLLLLLVPGAAFVVTSMRLLVGPEVWIPWLIAAVGTIALLARIGRRLLRHWTGSMATAHLNRFAAFLLAVVVLGSIVTGSGPQAVRDLVPIQTVEPAAAAGRDVVILMLDGYPRADTLRRVFDYDNQEFIEDLEELGFSVARRSRANYTRTELTLVSMLHMRHLMDIPKYRRVVEGEIGEQPTLRNMINENPVFDRFREAGYKVITVAPGIERVTIRDSDHFIDSGTVNELEFHLLRSTALGGIVAALGPDWLAEQHRQRVLRSIDAVEELATESDGGRLIFGHILSPHMPAVLKPDGSLRRVPFSPYFFEERPGARGEEESEYIDAYIDQLTYLNARVERMVANVVTARPDSVVVVMSDHGSRVHFEWGEPDADLDERLATLLAIRAPGAEGAFEDGMTPINVFPVIFNAYFDADIALLPDATFDGVIELTEVPNPDAAITEDHARDQ